VGNSFARIPANPQRRTNNTLWTIENTARNNYWEGRPNLGIASKLFDLSFALQSLPLAIC
jgi:hypothetical protein